MKFKFPTIPKKTWQRNKGKQTRTAMLCSRSKIKHKIVEDPALIGMKEKNHYLMTTK